jgi:hypothetical protein
MDLAVDSDKTLGDFLLRSPENMRFRWEPRLDRLKDNGMKLISARKLTEPFLGRFTGTTA